MRYISLSAGVEYIEVPKCACTSIKTALLRSDGIEPRDGNHAHTHKHWESVPEGFAPRLVFSFVRDPFARIVSSHREKLATGKAKVLSGKCPLPTAARLEEWIEWVTSQDPATCDRHWRPQSRLLDRRRADLGVVGKLEHIAADWDILRRAVDGKLPDLPHVNYSHSDNASVTRALLDFLRKKLSPRGRRLVYDFYRDDYERFAYPIPD